MDAIHTIISDHHTGKSPVFIDFFASWCAPCQMFDPIFEELKTAMGDQVDFIKIDIDQFPGIAMKYEVKSVPTLILIKDSEEKWRMPGFLFARDLQKIIEQFI
jgi:thioredoxin 1